MDVVGRAQDALDLMAAVAEEKGLDLTLEAPEGGAEAYTDAWLVDRVLRHLVDNALKFTAEGGVRVRVANGDDAVTVEVADTGEGIPPPLLPRRFEEFRQGSEGYARCHEGSGLGLPITKRLVGLMGGTITVSSEAGRGSTFTVALPRVFTPAHGAGAEAVGAQVVLSHVVASR